MSLNSSLITALAVLAVLATTPGADAQLLRSRNKQCACQPQVVRYCPTPQVSYAPTTSYAQPTQLFSQPIPIQSNVVMPSVGYTQPIASTVYSQPALVTQPSFVASPAVATQTFFESVPTVVTSSANEPVSYPMGLITTPVEISGTEQVTLGSASDIPVEGTTTALVPTVAEGPIVVIDDSEVPIPSSTGDSKIMEPQPTPAATPEATPESTPATESSEKSVLTGT